MTTEADAKQKCQNIQKCTEHTCKESSQKMSKAYYQHIICKTEHGFHIPLSLK